MRRRRWASAFLSRLAERRQRAQALAAWRREFYRTDDSMRSAAATAVGTLFLSLGCGMGWIARVLSMKFIWGRGR